MAVHASDYPLADHGLSGDLHTCALVATHGAIDWFCASRFDSPAGLTGERLGGVPLAFTHLSLIDAAVMLDRRREGHPDGTADVPDPVATR